MSRNLSKPLPTSLRAAFEADKAHALAKHRRGTERLAELMATTPAALYKWLETDSMPVNRLAAWEHITGSDCVVRYLAAAAHRVVIEIPTGRKSATTDVHALQTTLNNAVGVLLAFMNGDADRDTTLAALGAGLESMAWHRENVRKNDQPELELN
jgi:hypothetical protein